MANVLVVEDRRSLLELWSRALQERGHVTVQAPTVRDALGRLREGGFDLVLTDLRLPDGEGTEVLEKVRTSHPGTPTVVLTAFGSVGNAVEAMKLGATDYLEKPVDIDELCRRVEGWLEPAGALGEGRVLSDGPPIVGSHPSLLAALRLVDKVAPTESTVLLLGESGTGKELFARAIHEGSGRVDGPFVPVNCAALPENLIENELFGHERGAFTGADRRQAGRFEAAEGGTLFLDEIGELPLAVQGKILRVLEERTFERIGGAALLRADVRLVAATNRDLEGMVADGAFREDLFYRLEVFPIQLPPLRERRSDIPALASSLLERIARRNGMDRPELSEGASRRLTEEDWPGNVRQLSNALERALIVGGSGSLEEADLAEVLQPEGQLSEERAVRAALREADGDRRTAARSLGVSLRTLQRRVRRYGLEGYPHYTD